jgi:uncharacterized repeat protein (TIGR01451 family)
MTLEGLEERTLLSVLTVTNLNDSASFKPGDGSLRGEIAAAAPNDTIEFGSNLAGDTITLDGNWLELTKNVTITAPAAGITINGNGQSNVLFVERGITASLTGITITNGYSSDDGGGISNDGNLTLTNCTVTNNLAQQDGGAILNKLGSLILTDTTINSNQCYGNGGGIDNIDGTVTITGGSIENGFLGGSGGAVYNDGGTVTVSNASIETNNAVGNGGGIDNEAAGTLTVNDSTLYDNNGRNGGGIFNAAGATATVTGGTFTSNFDTYSGGAIENQGNLTVTGVTFERGGSGFGGAIDSSGSLVVYDSFFGYSIANQGGGLDNETNGNATVVNSTFYDNSANNAGGNVANSGGTLLLTNCTLSLGLAAAGGGIANSSGSVTLANTLVAGNLTPYTYQPNDISGAITADYSLIGNTGGVTLSPSSANNLLNVNPEIMPPFNDGGSTDTCALEPGSPAIDAGSDRLAVDASGNPLKTDQRGGIFERISGKSVDIGAFEYNVFNLVVSTTSDENDGNDSYGHLSLREALELADQNIGGSNLITFDPTVFATPQAIRLNPEDGPIAISTNTSITGPAAEVTIVGDDLGRVFETTYSQLMPVTTTLSDLTIEGGGIYNAEFNSLTLENCTLTRNDDTPSPYVNGGALDNLGTATLDDSTLSDNTGTFGGAIYNRDEMTLIDCTITGNATGSFHLYNYTFPGSGGAIYNFGDLTINETSITGNTTIGDGGAIAGDGSVSISESSISGNSALGGGGIESFSGEISLIGTSVSDNHATYGGGISNGGTLSVQNCTISGNSAQTGGGIYNSAGTARIVGTTISNNSASVGGGLVNGYAFALGQVITTVANCTFYGNTASSEGGAVYSTLGYLSFTNCTITANQAARGAGLDLMDKDAAYGYYDVVTAANTIVADNRDAGTTSDDLAGSITASYDIFGATANGTFLAGSGNNILGVTDPGLGSLASNGGPTQTCALLPGSPAIDAGDSALALLLDVTQQDPSGMTGAVPLAIDQRGLSRLVGTAVDIGADEYQSDLSATLEPVVSTAVTGQSLTYTITVTNNGPDAAAPTLTDVVPAGTILRSWSTSAAGWVLTTPTVNEQVTATASPAAGDTLLPGTSATFSLTVQVVGLFGAVVTNEASVGPTTDDTNLANNATASDQTVVVLGISSITPVSPNPRNTAVSDIDVTFDEPINLGTFTRSALTLTNNGGANLITGAANVSLVSGSTYQIGGLAGLTEANGEYTLTVNSSGIEDSDGNWGANSLSTTWLMDISPPTSTVNPLPVRETSLTFAVSITATDQGSPASGVAYTTIYSSINNGPWTVWTTLIAPATTATFTGQSNNTYSFYSVATDYANNTQNASPVIEASTYVPDLTPPVTSVDGTAGPNPSTVNTSTGTFTLDLTGSDPGDGLLEYFLVYASIDGGPYREVGPYAIPAGSADASGQYHSTIKYQGLTDGNAHTYSFYSIGVDSAGNVQSAPASPNATFANQTFATPTQLGVSGFTVEHGSSNRSFIQYLDIIFNESDGQSGSELTELVNSISGPSPLIQVYKYDLNDDASSKTSVPLNVSTTSLDVLDHAIEINFGSGGVLDSPNSTAADGYYEVDIHLPNGNVSTHYFYRLLGDVDGDQTVDSNDLNSISENLNETSQIGWTALSADVNGDGTVAALDLTLATRSRGRQLKSGLTLG